MSLTRALVLTLAVLPLGACATVGMHKPGSDLEPEVVDVELRDARLDLSPRQVGPGKVGLEVFNQGEIDHALRVTGPGIDEPVDTDVSPGQHRRIWVKLKPGTYRVFCPDGDHADKGVAADLSVTEDAGWHRR